MQSQQIAMSMEEFHLLPRKLGWKYEYFHDMAYIRPRQMIATLTIPVEPRPVSTIYSLRSVTPTDRPALTSASYEAFRDTCEYCDWEDADIRKSATESIEAFFAGHRGAVLAASRLAMDQATIIGAALLVRDNDGPNLDTLFVRPGWQRKGVATALVSTAMNALYAEGERALRSAYDLANEPSMAWHHRFGFVEEPDLFLAQLKARYARYELRRREQIGDLTSEDRIALERECEFWKAQAAQLQEIADREGLEAVTPILRC